VPDEARAERLRQVIHRDRALPERLFMVTTSVLALNVLRGVTP